MATARESHGHQDQQYTGVPGSGGTRRSRSEVGRGSQGHDDDDHQDTKPTLKAVPRSEKTTKQYKNVSQRIQKSTVLAEAPFSYNFTLLLDEASQTVVQICLPDNLSTNEYTKYKSEFESVCQDLQVLITKDTSSTTGLVRGPSDHASDDTEAPFLSSQVYPGAPLKVRGVTFGTIGVLIAIGDKKYALTCAHLMYGPIANSNGSQEYPEVFSAEDIDLSLLQGRLREIFKKSQLILAKQCRESKSLDHAISTMSEYLDFFKGQNTKFCELQDNFADREVRIGQEVARFEGTRLLESFESGNSTIRISEDIDWALIELQLDKSAVGLGANSINWPKWLEASEEYPQWLGSRNGLRIRGCADEEKRGKVEVFKVGRSSGFTKGTINGVPSTRVVREPKNGGGFDRHFIESRWVVSDPARPFALPGDSGSCVVDTDGLLIGIIHRATTYGALFQDISQVFESIGTTKIGGQRCKKPRLLKHRGHPWWRQGDEPANNVQKAVIDIDGPANSDSQSDTHHTAPPRISAEVPRPPMQSDAPLRPSGPMPTSSVIDGSQIISRQREQRGRNNGCFGYLRDCARRFARLFL